MGRWQVGHTTRTAAADRSTVVRSASPRTHNSTPDGSDSSVGSAGGLRAAAPAVSIAASTRPTIAARSPDSSTIADALTPSGWSPRMPATITIFRWSPLPTGAPDTGAFVGVSPVDPVGAGSVAVGSVAVGSVAVGSVASVVEMSVGSGAVVVVGSVSAGFAVVALRVRRVVVAMVNYLHREWCGIRIRETRGALLFPVRRAGCLRPHVHGRSAPPVCQRRFSRLFVRCFSPVTIGLLAATRRRVFVPRGRCAGLCRACGRCATVGPQAPGVSRYGATGGSMTEYAPEQCRTRIRSIVAESQGAVWWLESLHDSGSIGSIRIGAK